MVAEKFDAARGVLDEILSDKKLSKADEFQSIKRFLHEGFMKELIPIHQEAEMAEGTPIGKKHTAEVETGLTYTDMGEAKQTTITVDNYEEHRLPFMSYLQALEHKLATEPNPQRKKEVAATLKQTRKMLVALRKDNGAKAVVQMLNEKNGFDLNVEWGGTNKGNKGGWSRDRCVKN